MNLTNTVSVQHKFDCFCKKVLQNEMRNYFGEIKRKRDLERPLSEISAQELGQLSILDEYCADCVCFNVLDYVVTVRSEAIANALSSLDDEKRYIVLLSYFLDMTDTEIGTELNMLRRTVQRRRTSSLRELKNLLEG